MCRHQTLLCLPQKCCEERKHLSTLRVAISISSCFQTSAAACLIITQVLPSVPLSILIVLCFSLSWLMVSTQTPSCDSHCSCTVEFCIESPVWQEQLIISPRELRSKSPPSLWALRIWWASGQWLWIWYVPNNNYLFENMPGYLALLVAGWDSSRIDPKSSALYVSIA